VRWWFKCEHRRKIMTSWFKCEHWTRRSRLKCEHRRKIMTSWIKWALRKEIAIQVSALMTVKDDANFGWIVTVCCNLVQHFPDHEREEKQKILQKK
jgi:hypothetical protein